MDIMRQHETFQGKYKDPMEEQDAGEGGGGGGIKCALLFIGTI